MNVRAWIRGTWCALVLGALACGGDDDGRDTDGAGSSSSGSPGDDGGSADDGGASSGGDDGGSSGSDGDDGGASGDDGGGDGGDDGGGTSSGGGTSECPPGTEGCPCINGECLGGELQCLSGICVLPDCPDPGHTNCGGDCVDLQTSDDHCGECDHLCLTASLGAIGSCEAGKCTPTTANNCTPSSESASWPTCSEVCADIGEACVTQGCQDTTYSVYTGCISDPDVVNPQGGDTIACSQPIDWGYVGSGAVRCCCTQP